MDNITSCLSFYFFPQKDLLKRCYSASASYLFQQDKFYDVSYDTGDKSIQCSRRPDAFKFWLAWKALGTLGLEERVNRALALSRYLLCVCVSVCLWVSDRLTESTFVRSVHVLSYMDPFFHVIAIFSAPSILDVGNKAALPSVLQHPSLGRDTSRWQSRYNTGAPTFW